MEELISVVVPIYNVEKYLQKCIDSILAQTYRHLEIILVDDGSPDNCGAICDNYAQEDGRKSGNGKDAYCYGFGNKGLPTGLYRIVYFSAGPAYPDKGG